MKELFSLDGQTILVTGSTRGIGWAIASACAQYGATVVIHGRDDAVAEARAAELSAAGRRADFVAFDMEDREAVSAVVPTLVERHGSIWGVVNNAGVARHEDFLESSLETFEHIVAVHVYGPYLLAKSAARAMLDNKGPDRGRILNIASIAVATPRAGMTHYTAAKNGLVGFTRALAAELGHHGICCNAIAPGYILTDMNRRHLENKAFVERINRNTPAARWGEPEELGGPAVFLLSPASSFVNGQVLFVDGGMSHFLPMA